MNQHARLLIIWLAWVATGPCFASDDFLSDVEGYYARSSEHCLSQEGNSFQDCEKLPGDCLIIKRLDPKHVALDVFSVQPKGYSCEVHVVADVELNEIRHVFDDAVTAKGEQTRVTLVLSRIGGSVRLTYQSNVDSFMVPFCGLNATLDLKSFELWRRQPLVKQSCPRTN